MIRTQKLPFLVSVLGLGLGYIISTLFGASHALGNSTCVDQFALVPPKLRWEIRTEKGPPPKHYCTQIKNTSSITRELIGAVFNKLNPVLPSCHRSDQCAGIPKQVSLEDEIDDFLNSYQFGNRDEVFEALEEVTSDRSPDSLGEQLGEQIRLREERRGALSRLVKKFSDRLAEKLKPISRAGEKLAEEPEKAIKGSKIPLRDLLPHDSKRVDRLKLAVAVANLGAGVLAVAADATSLGAAGVAISAAANFGAIAAHIAIDNGVKRPTKEGRRIKRSQFLSNPQESGQKLWKYGNRARGGLSHVYQLALIGAASGGSLIPYAGGIVQILLSARRIYVLAVRGSENNHEVLLAWENIYEAILRAELEEKQQVLLSLVNKLSSSDVQGQIPRTHCLCEAQKWLHKTLLQVEVKFKARSKYLNEIIDRKKRMKDQKRKIKDFASSLMKKGARRVLKKSGIRKNP